MRITAPTVKDAANLQHIVAGLRERGCDVPIVADIHFKPDAAMEAAKWVEKVRVNPGNYADSKKFAIKEYTDEQYAAELERIRERFAPLVKLCKEHGRAMRIGTNHGSLSDRIMNRYGDTPLGMVESALEFARIARDLGYHDFVFSMKSSNPKVMIEAYRLLVARLNEWRARTDSPESTKGAPIANSRFLVTPSISASPKPATARTGASRAPSASARCSTTASATPSASRSPRTACMRFPWRRRWPKSECGIRSCDSAFPASERRFPFELRSVLYHRRETTRIEINGVALGGEETVRVFTTQEKWDALAHKLDKLGDYKPEIVLEEAGVIAVDPRDESAVAKINSLPGPALVTVADGLDLPVIAAYRLLAARLDARHPILLKDTLKFGPESE